MAETTAAPQDNPFLQGIFSTKDMEGRGTTHRVASWLCEKTRALHKAPDGTLELSIYQDAGALEAYLAEYMACKDDETARRDPHRKLISATKELLKKVNKAFDIAAPSTKEKVEAGIESVGSARYKFSYTCRICSAPGRNYPEEGKNRHVCKECTSSHFVKCKGCNQLENRDNMSTVINNDTVRRDSLCPDCLPQEWKQCQRCGCKHIHNYNARVMLHPSVNRDQLQEIACYDCAPHYAVRDCGHTCYDGHKVPSKMPCLEDDEVEPPRKQTIVCRRCHENLPGRRRRNVEFWNSYKGNYGSKKHKELGSTRTYGVEIEVCEVNDVTVLDETMKNVWSCKNDASLPASGAEFASTVMRGDLGLDAIREFCRIAKREEWGLNEKAGMHLHVGIDDLTLKQRMAVNMAYQMSIRMWNAFCAPSRSHKNKYCVPHKRTPEEFYLMSDDDAWYSVTGECTDYARRRGENEVNGRRHWVNWLAFKKLKTVEIRLHQGTLNADKIVNWIKAHTRMVDWCAAKNDAQTVYKALFEARRSGRKMLDFFATEIWKDKKLGEWFRDRAKVLHRGNCCIHMECEYPATAPYGSLPPGFVIVGNTDQYVQVGKPTLGLEAINAAEGRVVLTNQVTFTTTAARITPMWTPGATPEIVVVQPTEDDEEPEYEEDYEDDEEEDEEEEEETDDTF